MNFIVNGNISNLVKIVGGMKVHIMYIAPAVWSEKRFEDKTRVKHKRSLDDADFKRLELVSDDWGNFLFNTVYCEALRSNNHCCATEAPEPLGRWAKKMAAGTKFLADGYMGNV